MNIVEYTMLEQYITTTLPPFSIENDDFYFLGCYVFSSNGKNLLLNRENGTTIFLSDELLNDLKERCPSDDLQFKLIQRGFAKTSNSPECRDASDTILPTFFIIDLTTACNLRCAYCFRHLSNETSLISDEMLERICDYIISYSKKHNLQHISVQPWGGEPLLAFPKIKRIRARFEEAGLKPHITIETNGTLVTPGLARELFENNIDVGVSIDGISEVHNAQRKLKNGDSSFEKVQSGMLNLIENGFKDKIGTISVITKNTISYLEDILDYFSKELKLPSIKFNLIRENCSMSGEGLSLEPDEIVSFVKRLLNKLVELHKDGYHITEGNIKEKLLNILMRSDRNICVSAGCMGGRKMVSFNKEGRIFPCEMTDYSDEAFGSIDDSENLVELIRRATTEKDYFAEKKSELCNECPWWYYCRGGCTSAIKYLHGTVNGIDETECLVNRVLYPELVRIIFEEPHVVQSLTGGIAVLSWG